jgi:type I restriction enzyme S subunit
LAPSGQVLRAFDDILQPFAERIVANDKQAELLALGRDALLPKLISGELRLKDAERLLAEAEA